MKKYITKNLLQRFLSPSFGGVRRGFGGLLFLVLGAAACGQNKTGQQQEKEQSGTQTDRYGAVAYRLPAGWDKQEYEKALQLSTPDIKTGEYAAVVIYKTEASEADAMQNFNSQWATKVKANMPGSETPTMFSPMKNKGWDIISGYADYTDGGNKGVIGLITATSSRKTVAVMLLSNTKIYENVLNDFANTLEFDE
jgi:hypothetical protein